MCSTAGAIVELIGAACGNHLADNTAGQQIGGVLPSDQVETLEALFDEIKRVPPSAKTRSVSAAVRISASTAGGAPMAMAVSTVRSAASRCRTETQRRSQRLSVVGLGAAGQGGTLPRRCLVVAVDRDLPDAVKQRQIRLFRGEGCKAACRWQSSGPTRAPAVAIARSEQRSLPHNLDRGHTSC